MSDRPVLGIALVQMNSGANVSANLAVAEQALAVAAERGAELAVLPENFAGMGPADDFRRGIAEADGDGPIQAALATMARRHGLWLVAGTVPLLSVGDDRPAAACCVYDDRGRRRGRYDKIHLFDVSVPGGDEAYRESANTAPGDQLLCLPTPWGRLGVAVCYDLRFPELFARLAQDGAELIALPAAFTRPTGRAHWEVLLRARATETLSYVAAAAQTGTHPGGRRTWGHSLLVGPWGEVLLDAGEETGVYVGELDMRRPSQLRTEFPVLQHRRLAAGKPARK